MTVKCVLFDLGNTLWHIPELPRVEQIRRETVGRILRLLRSWEIEPDERQRILGRDIRLATTHADRSAYDSDCVSPDFASIVDDVATKAGLDLTPAQAAQLWDTWNLEGAFFGRRLFDDALETLVELRSRGHRLGCVTNRVFGGESFVEEVAGSGLDQHFEAMAVSCEIGYMKPHRKIYEHALDALEIKPHEAIMVGDSLKADIAGAQALGMTAVWRRPRRTKEEIDGVEPDFVVNELSELLSLPCFQTNGASPPS